MIGLSRYILVPVEYEYEHKDWLPTHYDLQSNTYGLSTKIFYCASKQSVFESIESQRNDKSF